LTTILNTLPPSLPPSLPPQVPLEFALRESDPLYSRKLPCWSRDGQSKVGREGGGEGGREGGREKGEMWVASFPQP